MISYTLPDFVNGLSRNLLFLRFFKERPQYFIDDLRIDSVYGCFPSCILNGGRAFVREKYTAQQIERTFNLLSEAGLTTRLTFTNMLATEDHLADPYVATILDIAQHYPTEVIVYSDELAAALKARHGFKCVLSTTREIVDVDELNHMTELYDYVVLNYNKNKDLDFISRIEQPEKIEVMVNEFCEFECPHREAHYLHNSEDQLSNTMRPFPCYHTEKGDYFKHDPNHPIFLTDDYVEMLHNEYDIGYFKIVGRGIPFETILESYTYHLVKPAYRDSIKQMARQYLAQR